MYKEIAVICAGIAAGLAALTGYYIYRIAPNTGRKEQMRPFEETYIAHRGLFDNHSEAPENSLAAFRKAVDEGYGIELDVQMTADDRLVVFHDDTLERMCGIDRMLTECTYEELKRFRLKKSNEQIPLFDEVLEIIAGKVPLIVEVKSAGRWKETTQRMAERMDHYEGIYCMESFHPLAVAWFRKHRPDIIRGQLADDFFRSKKELFFPVKWVLSNMLMNNRSRPDFIAYNFKHADQFSYRVLRKLFPVENAAWTVKSKADLKKAKKIFDIFIFDSFIP